MMKKYFLKGKEFLKKKLDQLQIEHEDIDYVAEQIPKRLKQKLKIFESVDYDLESALHFAPYFRTYPNHPVSPLLYERFKQQTKIQYELHPKLRENKNLIPEFDAKLQQKAFALKYVVDSYQQGLPELQSSLLCICVVHFHHKRGTQIEYRYPSNPNVQQIEDIIVHCAMPDSSHNKGQDYNFFNFQATIDKQKKMLFGVSYFKQIKLTQAMKAKNQQLTRSHVQKAVCIVSFLPIFGYLKMRLALTTKIFFQNFTNFQSIKHSYLDMNKHLNQTWQKIDYSELYIGTDLRRIFKLFGYKFFQIYKAILYQKRIVIFSHSPSSSSSFILSILSLFPGLLAFGMYSGPINRYLEGLREYSLPLKLFSDENPLILSFHIQDFHLLQRFKGKKCEGNYLIGTTNRLVKETKNIGIQMLVNLEDCSVQWVQSDESQIWEGVTKQQKIFVDEILKVLEMDFTCGYQGSQDWIRDNFHDYLKDKLVKIVEAKRKYLEFVNECRKYEGGGRKRKLSNKDKKLYSLMQDEDQISVQKEVAHHPQVDESVLNIPLVPLLNKSHFVFFLQFHNPNLYLLSQKYKYDEILIIENCEYYVGSLPMKEKQYIIYNIKTRKLKFGNKSNSSLFKQIKFDENNQISQIFIGKQLHNRYNGSGFLINQNQSYQGQFLNHSKHGFGKFISNVQNYIGNFQHGIYNGQGQLINHIQKTLYVGNFKDGLREGQGKLQKDDFIYEGEFVENQMQGTGQLNFQQKQLKIYANFIKGNIDEEKQVTIKYKNGDAYAGTIKNLQPHGEGIYQTANGQLKQGKFEFGEFIKQQSK